ncbi:ATP-binding cassette domain-containing protein [Oligoflexaceae bacterium]|nr:ATP-binding cassette domain-containing protein [Oligoflexaceae bacterium]
MSEPILEVKDLKMHFPIRGGILQREMARVYAVDGVSFSVNAGETLGLVGESGCGKSTIGRSLVRLHKATAGSIRFMGQELTALKGEELREVRKSIQMIFQDPAESLNSRHTVGEILVEPFIIQGIGNHVSRSAEVRKLLDLVGLPQTAIHKFPHEFSGGQKQRIGIARAISLNPKLIVCDEPVSALDVSIQSQIVNLLLDLQAELNLAYVFIAHDLSVVRHVSDQVAVMYLGRIVEQGDADELYADPKHPYTRALIDSIPVADPTLIRQAKAITGDVPSPIAPPRGCHFHGRCPVAQDTCRQSYPQETQTERRRFSCHFPI